MIHLKRFLWLFAWSVWIWLGFGLYRELPRNLGSSAFMIPLDGKLLPLGFVDNGSVLAVLKQPSNRSGYDLLFWETVTGRSMADLNKPGLQGYPRGIDQRIRFFLLDKPPI